MMRYEDYGRACIPAVFTENDDARETSSYSLKKRQRPLCVSRIHPGLYEELGREYRGFTVPAMNIRGLTYDTARLCSERPWKRMWAPLFLRLRDQK